MVFLYLSRIKKFVTFLENYQIKNTMQRLLYNPIIINIILKIFKSRYGFTVKHVFGRKSATNRNPQYARVLNINIILFWGHQLPPTCGKEKGPTYFLVHHKQHISHLHINRMFGYTIWRVKCVFFFFLSNMILVKLILGLYIGLNSSIQNRLLTCKARGATLYKLFSDLISFQCKPWVFPNTPPHSLFIFLLLSISIVSTPNLDSTESIKNDFFNLH